ncbi:MAG TPA: sugar phosphate isomerase/epimerase [Roseiflexaceae bacterium]|nr:sugar phosphate isomerase/epimerase [Roseiflexaceae bacterium]
MTHQPLAVQLYTLRDAVEQDYLGTLRAVAELGYGAVELVTLGKYSAEELRRELDLLGLRVAAMHVALAELDRNLPTVLENIRTLGANYIVCPWLPPERRGSAASYREVAEILTRAGRESQSQGVQLCYHHHEFEFNALDGTSGFEILAEVDPALLQFEIDVYWAAFAGHDPAALLGRLAGRVPLVHLKDMTADDTRTFAEVGHGQLDFSAILSAADAAGVQWLIVEQDRCARPPLESVGMSLSYLRSLGR